MKAISIHTRLAEGDIASRVPLFHCPKSNQLFGGHLYDGRNGVPKSGLLRRRGSRKNGAIFVRFYGVVGLEQMYYNVQHRKGGAIVKVERDNELGGEGLSQEQQKIIEMLKRINDQQLLDRIYRFIKYIYIHKT